MCLRSFRMRCPQIYVKPERRTLITTRIVCGVRRHMPPTGFRTMRDVSHLSCSFGEKDGSVSRR